MVFYIYQQTKITIVRFLIISHALHYKSDSELYSYAPYVREMNLWLKYVDVVEIVAPFSSKQPSKIDLAYRHNSIVYSKIPEIALTSLKHSIKTVLALPIILYRLLIACHRADHIHLRCPGNIGLLGCLVQICFPKKIKTAKYAGNWDPKAKQPKSYKIQKWLLSNTFLTKNMTVLVYGKWKDQSKNIKSFFTATYTNSEKPTFKTKVYNKGLKFLFVGSLVKGKRPLLAIKIIAELHKKGHQVSLDLFGDGILKQDLQNYILKHHLTYVKIHGNQTKETITNSLIESHFSILASKSEGWPKAIAEAMFYGVIPIATKISCVPYMLDEGQRGILIEPDLHMAVNKIDKHITDESVLQDMSKNALHWSQNYTLDYFESEIKALLKQ